VHFRFGPTAFPGFRPVGTYALTLQFQHSKGSWMRAVDLTLCMSSGFFRSLRVMNQFDRRFVEL